MHPLKHIAGEAHVAVIYGMEEAVFLDAIMFWYRTNRANANPAHFRDGRWWTYNSIKAFEAIFPWWTGGQIRRVIARCMDKGALLSGNYNKDRRDRTSWYTPSDELLALYCELENGNSICRNRQMQEDESTPEIAENGEPLPCRTHVETDMKDPPIVPPGSPQDCRPGRPAEPDDGPTGDAAPSEPEPVDKPEPKRRRSRAKKSVPTHAPERFEQFWAFYPGGGSRLKAVEEWDALAPDDALIDEMARALKRQKNSRQWQDGVGIPHASRWLRDRRWTDKLPETPQSRNAGGWADDPDRG